MATQTTTPTATTASPGTPEPVPPWMANLDIAALVGALAWPIAVFFIFFMFRKTLPEMVSSLASRVRKLEFAGISLDLAEVTAKPFEPDWSGVAGAFDLRNTPTLMEINSDARDVFFEKLAAPGTADYVLVNLSDRWLTSRLYIMAILFARMKGVTALVFLRKTDNICRRYVGWAEPTKVRWALAKKYPWLEEAYADAYSQITKDKPNRYLVVDTDGRLGTSNPINNSPPDIELFKKFLKNLQSPLSEISSPEDKTKNWLPIIKSDDKNSVEPGNNPYEHACLITSVDIQEVLGRDLHTNYISMNELRIKRKTKKLQRLLSNPGHYIAITTEGFQFDRLIDRSIILEKVAEKLSDLILEEKQ